jgi:hypothetical protein
MDEQAVREHAKAYCNALLASDIGLSAHEMSKELQAKMGSIVGMLPLPLTEASIETIDSTPTGYKAVLHLVGEHDTIRLETRWKDRDGRPTMVEASHIPEAPVAPEADAQTDETQE